MKMTEQNLPKPGRELDAWIWSRLGYEVYRTKDEYFAAGAPHTPYFNWKDCQWPVYWNAKAKNAYIVPFVSTSAAFFQVMEAMESYRFHFIEHRDGLTLLVREVRNDVMWERNWPVTRVDGVAFSDYPDREHACAHAVCAAMYLAEKGEDDGV